MFDTIMASAGIPSVVVLILGIIVTVIIKNFLNVKRETVLNDITNDNIRTYVDLLWSTVESTVSALNQTMVDGLKEKSEDGKLTEEEANEVKKTAIDMVMSSFSSDAKGVLSLVFDDLETYIGSLIESAVKRAKEDVPLG